MTIKDLKTNETAVVKAVGGSGALRQHFLDMGVIPGTHVTLIKYAPMGDPLEIRLHSYELTLRVADAAQIEVEHIKDEETSSNTGTNIQGSPDEKTSVQKPKSANYHKEHPGLGEGGKYHEKETENPLPKDKTLTFALAGNQNCGKTTLFNQLTGAQTNTSETSQALRLTKKAAR